VTRRQLAESGVRYAMLGHFHDGRADELICYPGSPEPLGWGERAGRHAAAILSVSDDACECELVEIARRRYAEETVRVDGAAGSDEIERQVAAAAATHAGAALLVTLEGEVDPACEIDPPAIAARCADGLDELRVRDHTHPAYDNTEIIPVPGSGRLCDCRLGAVRACAGHLVVKTFGARYPVAVAYRPLQTSARDPAEIVGVERCRRAGRARCIGVQSGVVRVIPHDARSRIKQHVRHDRHARARTNARERLRGLHERDAPEPDRRPIREEVWRVLCGAELGRAPITFNAEYPAPGDPVGSLHVASSMRAADHAGSGVGHAARGGKNSRREKGRFICILSSAGTTDVSADIATGPAVNGHWSSVHRRRHVRGHPRTGCHQREDNTCEQQLLHDTSHQ